MNVLSEEVKGYDGFLFIGDLHLSSARVGRRIDDYARAGLDKLSQAAVISKERNLLPVCLGDFFHRAGENSIQLLASVTEVLREFSTPLIVLGGSHDHLETKFTAKDSVKLLANMGLLRLVETSGKILTLERENGQRIHLWGTPAGFVVPDAVPYSQNEHNIMITHHDFDFNGKYPGAHELHEIENCSVMVNGHMHTPTPMVLKGQTACHNPGSTMRVSVDLKKHKPVVSVWTPAHGISLESVYLKVADLVFDLTGKEVFAAETRDLKATLPKGLRLSSFAAQLREKDSMEATRTDDGSVMVEELNAYFSLFPSQDNLKRYLGGLLKDVVAEKLAA